ncbi:hypothetical protein PO909_025308, partial [Leuciscus waleckii]
NITRSDWSIQLIIIYRLSERIQRAQHTERERDHIFTDIFFNHSLTGQQISNYSNLSSQIAMDCRNEGCTQPQDEDIMDIPLDDPAANKAAAKIQAGFRGHMTRKKMKDDKPREEKQREQK